MEETLRRLERLHVRAWPALESERIGGWLWRWSGGASQRANSVSTLDFTEGDFTAAGPAGLDFTAGDPARALEQVEARYAAKGAPPQWHTYDMTRPPALPGLLRARGYEAGETTLTMMTVAQPAAPPEGVEAAIDPTGEWLAVYLGAITQSRRAINRLIVPRIPGPRAFFSVRREGEVVSCALGAAHGGHAVAECVATRAEARGQRGAETALRALLSWAASLSAHTVGLQVVETNAPAIRLYQRLGFQVVCANRFWVKRE